MKVRDVMTVSLFTLTPESPIREAIKLILERRIGGAPVVAADGGLAGVVTISDLLSRTRKAGRGRPSGRGAPKVVGEVMSTAVLTLAEDMTLAEAARALGRRGVKRAPVIRDARLVGMVTRSDLLRPYLRTDGEIRAEIEMDVLVGTLGLSPRTVQVEVDQGAVTLSGPVPEASVQRILRRLVRSVDGVVEVNDETAVGAAVVR